MQHYSTMSGGLWSEMVGWDVWCYDMEKTHSMEQLPNNSMPRLGQALPQDEEADQKVWGEINPEA